MNESNSCSEELVNILSGVIKDNTVLKPFAADPLSGGRTIDILSPLWPKSRGLLLKELSQPDTNFIIQANYEGMTTDIFKIITARDGGQREMLNSEIRKIYERHAGLKKFQTCMTMRESLEAFRKRLIEMMK